MRQAGNSSSVDKLQIRKMFVSKRTIPGKSPARTHSRETLAAIQMNRIRKRFRIFAGTKLKDKNVKYNFFQTIKDGNPQSGLPISLIFKERNYAYFTEYFIHTPQQRFTV